MKKENKQNDAVCPVYSGTSGLVVPEANKQLFPAAFQDKSRLTYYASLFNSIEINSSFKKLPMPRTIEKWAASVPDDFQFTFKCWNAITHNKELAFNVEDVYRFLQVVDTAGNKKGCLLVQFPGKLNIDHAEQLRKLLTEIRQADPNKQWKLALEFRNSSWYQSDVYQLLTDAQASLVLHDMPSSAPQLDDFSSPLVYVRFHGTERGYRGSYSDDFLKIYAEHVRGWRAEGKSVYVYFNNTLGGAAHNLVALNRYIHRD